MSRFIVRKLETIMFTVICINDKKKIELSFISLFFSIW